MKKLLLLAATMVLLISSCSTPPAPKNELLVVLSKDKTGNTEGWIKTLDSTVNIVVMFGLPNDSVDYYLQKADAIILTGGEDVNPMRYNKPELTSLCETIDDYRDSLEVAMINYAFASQTPILGICRGLQLMNVTNGGTLLADIPTVFNIPDSIHRNQKSDAHTIVVDEDSWIAKNFDNQSQEIFVNTIHHQAVDQVAPNFKVTVKSPEGIAESIELIDQTTGQFAIGVQWHPEKLRDELSAVLGNMLLDEAKAKKEQPKQN